MLIDLKNSTPEKNYSLLTGAISPRPLMWILTEEEGECSVAPYSFVNILSTAKPLISIAFGRNRDEEIKGTLKTILEKKKAVFHVTLEDHLDDIYASAAKGSFLLNNNDLKHEADGFPPRIKSCPIALYCEFCDMMDLENANTHLVICEIKHIYIEEGVDMEDLKVLSCMGGTTVLPFNKNKK